MRQVTTTDRTWIAVGFVFLAAGVLVITGRPTYALLPLAAAASTLLTERSHSPIRSGPGSPCTGTFLDLQPLRPAPFRLVAEEVLWSRVALDSRSGDLRAGEEPTEVLLFLHGRGGPSHRGQSSPPETDSHQGLERSSRARCHGALFPGDATRSSQGRRKGLRQTLHTGWGDLAAEAPARSPSVV